MKSTTIIEAKPSNAFNPGKTDPMIEKIVPIIGIKLKKLPIASNPTTNTFTVPVIRLLPKVRIFFTSPWSEAVEATSSKTAYCALRFSNAL